MRAERQTVDLTAYPDLVVIYLGMRVRRPRGLLRLFGLGPQIQKSWKAEPDGLLLHEDLVWSIVPPHLGMRQYWRDLDSLERWTRSEPHRRWWQDFLQDSGAMFSARHRAGRHEEALTEAPVITEKAYYDPAAPMGNGPHELESSDDAMAPDQGSGVNRTDQRASAKR